MKGVNKMRVNEATMMDMVQYYFDNVLYSKDVTARVKSVQTIGDPPIGHMMFEITVEGKSDQ